MQNKICYTQRVGIVNTIIAVVLLMVLQIIVFTIPVNAAHSVDVTITAQPAGFFAPTNFDATTVNDNKITLTWTPNGVAVGTMVRAKVGSYPVSATDGVLVYNGAGNTVDDTSVDLSETTANIFYSAWSVDGIGTTSVNYAQDNTGSTSMVFLGLVVLLIGGCVVASRSSWFGYKLGTGFIGFLWWMYVTSNPPNGVITGSGVHIALVWAPLVLALMAVLAGLGRGINQSESRTRNGETVNYSSENFGFHLPDWMKNMTASDTNGMKRQKQAQSLEEYRMSIRQALHPNNNQRRR